MRVPAYWSSWSDCLPMILARHPRVAVEFIRTLQGNPDTSSLAEAAGAARDLHLHGRPWPGVPARMSESWTTLSEAVTAGDGSTKRHSESKNSSVRSKFSPLRC